MAFQQLVLPFDDGDTTGPARGINRTRRIFVNRNLRLTGAAYVGFDMDYTLAIYDQPEMDDLSIRATIEKLIKRGYPDVHQDDPAIDRSFPIRGLLIDKRFGHILKMDRYKVRPQGLPRLARAHERGAPRALPLEEDPPGDAALPLDRHALRAQRGRHSTRRSSTRWRRRATRSTTRGSSPTSASASTRRTATARSSTRSRPNLPRFVDRDPNLAPTLHKLRSAGKKLFLLTNSRWAYTER